MAFRPPNAHHSPAERTSVSPTLAHVWLGTRAVRVYRNGQLSSAGRSAPPLSSTSAVTSPSHAGAGSLGRTSSAGLVGGGGFAGGSAPKRASVSLGTPVFHGYQYFTGRPARGSNAARSGSTACGPPAKNPVQRPESSVPSSRIAVAGGLVMATGSTPPN